MQNYGYKPRSRGQSTHGSGPFSYLMPFLFIICVGLIGVLLYNLWSSVYEGDLKKGATFYLVEGQAKLKSWGTDHFFELPNGSYLMQGDEFQLSNDGKAIIHFFDGTIMRADKNADLIIEEINTDPGSYKIRIILLSGNIWFNKIFKDSGKTYISVVSTNIVVGSDNSSIFEVEASDQEAIRVINGEQVSVDVLAQDNKEKIVETEKVGIGQEIIFSSKILEKYWQYQSPTVLSAMSDDFKQSSWYLWNLNEDKSPTGFDGVKVSNTDVGFVDVEPMSLTNTLSEASTTSVSTEDVAAPVVLTPAVTLKTPELVSVSGGTQTNANGFYVISSDTAVIKGKVAGATKILVNDFELKKYKPGEEVFYYYANSNYGFMKKGENTYNIFALDMNGNKSSPLVVRVLYEPKEPEATVTNPASVITPAVPVPAVPAPTVPTI